MHIYLTAKTDYLQQNGLLYVVCWKLSCPELLFVKYVVRLKTSFWLYRVVSWLYISTIWGLWSWYKLVILHFTYFNLRHYIEYTFYFFVIAKIHTLVLCTVQANRQYNTLPSFTYLERCVLYIITEIHSWASQFMMDKMTMGQTFVIIIIQILRPSNESTCSK
jgi:hypothetical protein